MKITKGGNVRIEINPERKYQGQFVGYRYYKMGALEEAFPGTDFAEIDDDGFDIGDNATNSEIIPCYVLPFSQIGYTVQ